MPVHGRRLGRLASHVSVAMATAEQSPAKPPHPFRVEDAQALRSVGSVCVSPTGSHVCWTQTQKDLEADTSEASVWMASTSIGGTAPIRLSAPGAGSAGSPAWSPDGSLLCFVASREIPAVLNDKKESISTAQVWAYNMAGGDAQPLTRVKQGVSSFVWSPSKTRLRLLLSVRDPDPAADAEEKEREKPKPWVMDRQQFKVDYKGYLHNVCISRALRPRPVSPPRWPCPCGLWRRCDCNQHRACYLTPLGARVCNAAPGQHAFVCARGRPRWARRRQPHPDHIGNPCTLRQCKSGPAARTSQVRPADLMCTRVGAQGTFDESDATWSPDGNNVAFASNRTPNPDGNSSSNIWWVQTPTAPCWLQHA